MNYLGLITRHAYADPRQLRLFSSVSLSLVLSFACTQIIPPDAQLPPPSDPNVSAAEQAFLGGDWKTLKALISRLPGEGSNLSESLFYQAVALGIDDAKRGAKEMKTLQASSTVKVREKAALLYLVFKAQSGDCLLTEGALRRVYWPKVELLPKGSRSLLEEALRHCDDLKRKSHDKVSAINEGLKVVKEATGEGGGPQAEAQSDEPKSAEEGEGQVKHLANLTSSERQSISPYLQLWLPLVTPPGESRAKPSGINTLLSESAPLLVDQRESRGERVTLERLDVSVEGELSVSMRVAELRSEVDAIIAVTPSRELHNAVTAASKTYQRPLFMMTPFKLSDDDKIAQGEEAEPLEQWRIYPDRKLIAASLVKVAAQSESQGVGLLIPEGPQGVKTLGAFKSALKRAGVKLTHHRALSSEMEWDKVASELRTWPVDTLIFASLPQLSITSLVTHLAAKGVWSAEPSMFEEPLTMRAERPDQDLYRRYLLWPSAYEQRTLDQAGRYLEGARTVSPVVRETPEYQALDRQLRREVGRGAELLDAIGIDLLSCVDEAIRVSRVKQRKLIDALQGGAVLKYLKKLDFSKESPLTELYTIEVHEQRFRRVQERSIQATEEEQKEPLEGDKRGDVLTHRDEAKEKVSPEEGATEQQ